MRSDALTMLEDLLFEDSGVRRDRLTWNEGRQVVSLLRLLGPVRTARLLGVSRSTLDRATFIRNGLLRPARQRRSTIARLRKALASAHVGVGGAA